MPAGRWPAAPPVVYVVPPGVESMVLPSGGPSVEVRGAPDLTFLDASTCGPLGPLRISGCPRLELLRLDRSQGTLVELDRPTDAAPLRITGLIGLVSLRHEGQTIPLPKLPEARRLCRDGYIGPAGSVPADVQLVVCIGEGAVAGIEAHRAPVRLAIADPRATSLYVQAAGMHSLTLVLLHLCSSLEVLVLEPDVAAVSISECHAFRRIAGAGFTVRVSRCHPGATPRAQLDIGGPWRMVWLNEVQYALVTGVADAFTVRESPLIEHVASWVDTQLRTVDELGNTATDRRKAHPMHLQEAVRLAVSPEPGAPPIDERVFARLPNAECVRVCLLALAEVLARGASAASVWRVREALRPSDPEFKSGRPNRPERAQVWAESAEDEPEDARAWQADIAILEDCRGGREASPAVRAAARDQIDRLVWLTDPWAIRMLAQARSERIAAGRDHGWISGVLGTLFRPIAYEPDENELEGDRMARLRPEPPAPSLLDDGAQIVAHLLAGRHAVGGEALLEDCALWLHQTLHHSGGMETLGLLARSGVPGALRALAEVSRKPRYLGRICGWGAARAPDPGRWSDEDRARALPFLLGVLHLRPLDPGRQP